jgi:hypothetical protein
VFLGGRRSCRGHCRRRAYQADPTGSQAVHGVQVVTVLDEDACQAAFDAAPVCFVQTNTRSLAEPAAAGRAARAAWPDGCRRTAPYAAAEPRRLHAARSRDGGGGDTAGGPMSRGAPAAPWSAAPPAAWPSPARSAPPCPAPPAGAGRRARLGHRQRHDHLPRRRPCTARASAARRSPASCSLA